MCCFALSRVSAGPERGGVLETLLAEHRPTIDAVLWGQRDPADVPDWTSLTAALDAATGQKDGWASGLRWYDDLEVALGVARAEGKPVLSLRMLGRLDQDLSCANSRLFRLLLYPDPAVNEILREHFVLHWHSVRAAPRLTVDYGDGRVIERTITGNSLHYVLSPDDGVVIDVMPGLVDAATFADWLRNASALHRARDESPAEASAVQARHWQAVTAWRPLPLGVGARQDAPAVAMQLAVSKSFIEAPAFNAVRIDADETVRLETNTFLAINPNPALQDLHPRVAGLIRLKEGGDTAAKIVRLRETLGRDTRINRDTLRPRIAAHLREAGPGLPHEALTTWVYDEVFRSPLDDPWSGLVDPAVVTGLDHAGVTQP